MTDDLHARLLAEIERREYEANAARGLLGVETEWFDVDNMRGRGLTRADAAHIADNSPKRVLAYLAALRGVVELHRNAGGGCRECEYDYPCATLRCVAEVLGVEA